METTYRALVKIPRDTAIPEDIAMNVLHFRGTSALTTDVEDADDIVAALATFYQAIDNTFFASVVASPLQVIVYDLADAEPRAALLDTTITISPSAGPDYPTEVAVCLSFQADQVSGQPQARRRGRIFIGPCPSGISTSANGRVNLDGTEQNLLVAAADTLKDDAAAAGVPWAVYSPTTDATSSLAAATFLVTNGWVDNAFDTIRSRGTAATVRTEF